MVNLFDYYFTIILLRITYRLLLYVFKEKFERI